MKNLKLLSVVSLFFLICVTSFGQEKWSVEFRPGINFPTTDITEDNTEIGYGFEITGAYKVMPHLAIYAGWGWNQFTGEASSLQQEITFEETGYTFGLQFIHPIGTSPISYLVRAGAVYNHIEMENNAGDITADTGHSLGWQLGAGIEYEITENWFLRPELRYRSLSGEIEVLNTTTELDLNYVSFGIGLVRTF